ncbi:mechanosensitive ion channel [Lampropedia puyangensis]|uniref:Mechanosensitive ion channel n=1 Tax=Lampropedia puyangensis TaxID=1330072 RepID=A0A4S8EV56_9BURK|nr:mechanosensitive ion channel domain-containing protein [Lampropedia puyangensis]THT98652.1 mechanosensitive ion channel [Lampropedia puyangensis]
MANESTTSALSSTSIAAPPVGEALAGTSFLDWLDQFSGPQALVELAIIAATLLVIFFALRSLRNGADYDNPDSVLFGRKVVDGVLFPLLGLLALSVVRTALAPHQSILLLTLAIPLLTSLLLIRAGVKVLKLAFPGKRWVEPVSRSFSWLIWACVALWIIGLGPTLLNSLDAIHWGIGGKQVSVLRLLESLLTAGLFLLGSLWISSAIENKLMASASAAHLPGRKAITTAVRAVLLFIGLLVAMNMAGIDLTALSVFGGALGVGIGLGLQRLAANYVSGFVLFTERVIRVGDTIKVGGFEGTVVEMSGRYTAILASSGRQAIVPHDMLTSTMVEKISTTASRALQSISMTVDGGNDAAVVARMLVEAAQSQPRVLTAPAPFANLLNVSASGLEFKLNYYIGDLSAGGTESLRSAINLAILSAFDAGQVTIAAPQTSLNWQDLNAWLAQATESKSASQAPQANDNPID